MCDLAMSLKNRLVKTNDPNIVVYKDLLQPVDCNEIADYVIQEKINNTEEEGMPWEKGNSILLNHIDKKFFDYINPIFIIILIMIILIYFIKFYYCLIHFQKKINMYFYHYLLFILLKIYFFFIDLIT